MRKLYTLLLLLFLGSVAWGQSVLFERGFDESSQGISYNNCLAGGTGNGNWYAMGSKEYCSYASCASMTMDGRIFNNDPVSLDENSQVLASTNAYPYYVCGFNKIAHDYTDPNAYGFIYKLIPGGSSFSRIESIEFGDGFYDIDVKGNRILALGSKTDSMGEPTGVKSIVEYNTSGTYVGQHLLAQNAIAVRLLGDRSIVFHANSTSIFDNTLQADGSTFPVVQGYKDASLEHDGKLCILTQNGIMEVDTALNLIGTFVLSSSINHPRFISRSQNGHIAVYGQHNGTDKILVLNNALQPIDSFNIQLACAEIVDVVMNDSIIAIAGNEELISVVSGFVKTYTYSGNTFDAYEDLVITNAELIIDGYVDRNEPGVNVYDIDWHADITVTNTGTDTVTSFTVHGEEFGGYYCISSLSMDKYEYVSIAPGESLSFSGVYSTSVGWGNDTVVLERDIMIRNINHGIYKDACPQSFTIRQIIVGLHNKALPEKNIKMYPNPSTGIYHINDAPMGSIMVQDLQGRVILMAEVHDKTTLDLSAQSQGMYLYTVIDTYGRSVAAGKLIKQ